MVISSHSDALGREIERSRSILQLGDDWDGEGSVGYSESTWQRARDFLECGAAALAESCSVELPVPRIGPGPEGSIDLHWQWPGRELLVNIPRADDEPVTFYGDGDSGCGAIHGEVSPNIGSLRLFVWIAT